MSLEISQSHPNIKYNKNCEVNKKQNIADHNKYSKHRNGRSPNSKNKR